MPLKSTTMIQFAQEKSEAKNVLGGPLAVCGTNPMTGYFRDGCCKTDAGDVGSHTVCAKVTSEFLEFSASRGNDLMTANPTFGFPGLKHGDRWCLCAARWLEAFEAGVAPSVVLEATHEKALEIIELTDLQKHAVAG